MILVLILFLPRESPKVDVGEHQGQSRGMRYLKLYIYTVPRRNSKLSKKKRDSARGMSTEVDFMVSYIPLLQ